MFAQSMFLSSVFRFAVQLEVFKKTLMQSLQEDEDPAVSYPRLCVCMFVLYLLQEPNSD